MRYVLFYILILKLFKELEGALEDTRKDQKKLQLQHKKLQEEFEEKEQISENKEEVNFCCYASYLRYLVFLEDVLPELSNKSAR